MDTVASIDSEQVQKFCTANREYLLKYLHRHLV